MFGKAKNAQDILKLINELSEEEQDKLFSALVADEEAEEKIEDAQAEAPVEETSEEVAEQEEAEEDVNEALVARIDSLESQLAEMVERVNAIVENSEKGSFASPEAPHGFDEGNTMSEAENNYFRKANRR